MSKKTVASSKPTTRRRNTIWDLADLRIRPDGTRIAQDLIDGTRPANSRTLREGSSVVMTSRGWVANAAGGSLPGARKRRIREKTVADDDNDGETFDVDNIGAGESSKAGQKRKARGTGRTAQRRRRLEEDLSFLTNEPAPRIPLNMDGTPFAYPTPPAVRPLPDSDLIKNIHYKASEFYTKHNYMHDLPAQHRAARRVRKAARLQEQAKEEAIAAGQDPGPQIEYKEDWAPWVLAKKPGRRKKEDEIPKGMIPKDMYRAFNYSAIMCIAMLVQEHVWSQTARQPPPEGWREPSPGYYEREEEEDAPAEFNPANLRAHRIFHRSVGNYEPPRRDQFWTEEDEAAEAAAAASRAQKDTEAASGSEYEPDD